MHRRRFLPTLAALGTVPIAPLVHPSQVAAAALHITLPAEVGSSWDVTGRALGRCLIRTNGAARVEYNNRAGAAGAIALARFVNTRVHQPHSLLVTGASMLGGAVLGKNPLPLRKATALARLTEEYLVLTLPAASPYRNLQDALARLKKFPHTVVWAGDSRGSMAHLAATMLTHTAGVDPARLRYLPLHGEARGTTALADGRISICCGDYSALATHITAHRLRPIAVTAPHRLPLLPHVPTLREQSLDVVLSNWHGIYGAPGLTSDQHNALIEKLRTATASPWWEEALRQHGWNSAWLAGTEFEHFVHRQIGHIRKMMMHSGILVPQPGRPPDSDT